MEYLYSIFDSKAEGYSPPFCAKTDGLATRVVKGAVVPGTSLYDYPADFTLYRIGSFDPVSGIVTGNAPAQFVANVSSLIDVAKHGLSESAQFALASRLNSDEVEQFNGPAISDDASVLGSSSGDDSSEQFPA
jgi:hypothetical protein